jgi:hypothetical protein
VPTKRGAHLALSLERLEGLAARSSASACPRHSGRWTKSRGSWAELRHRAEDRVRYGELSRKGKGRERQEEEYESSGESEHRLQSARLTPLFMTSSHCARDSLDYRPVTIVDTSEKRSSSSPSKCRSRTWRGWARRRRSQRPGLVVRQRRRSGPRFIRAARAGAGSSIDPDLRQQPRVAERLAAALNELAGRRWSARTTDRWRGRSGSRSRTA